MLNKLFKRKKRLPKYLTPVETSIWGYPANSESDFILKNKDKIKNLKLVGCRIKDKFYFAPADKVVLKKRAWKVVDGIGSSDDDNWIPCKMWKVQNDNSNYRLFLKIDGEDVEVEKEVEQGYLMPWRIESMQRRKEEETRLDNFV